MDIQRMMIQSYLSMPGMAESLAETLTDWLQARGYVAVAFYSGDAAAAVDAIVSEPTDAGNVLAGPIDKMAYRLVSEAVAGIVGAQNGTEPPAGFVACAACHGSGYDAAGELCETCGGRGYVTSNPPAVEG